MRLSNAQVRDVLHQMKAKVVPADHPVVPQLEAIFGLHTFFLRDEGLHVVERGEVQPPEGEPALVVKIANWTDPQHTALEPQPAEIAGAVDIGPEMADLPYVDPETGEPDPDRGEQDPLAGHGRQRRGQKH